VHRVNLDNLGVGFCQFEDSGRQQRRRGQIAARRRQLEHRREGFSAIFGLRDAQPSNAAPWISKADSAGEDATSLVAECRHPPRALAGSTAWLHFFELDLA
jgi:hypothetical protein